MKFTKMQGAGNDYLFLNCLERVPADLPGLARRLSQRHFGVGADGLICVLPSQRGDFRMGMFNADGSVGAMCGNGIRCLGKLVYESGLTPKTVLDIETDAGLRRLWLHLAAGQVRAVTVDLGVPEIGSAVAQKLGDREFHFTPVNLGNPHGVAVVERTDTLNLSRLGPALEASGRFPGGVNGEFVQVLSTSQLRLRVWERGSGETLACGTGACAAVAALASQGLCNRRCTVEQPGGPLEVDWSPDNGCLYLTGPAETVFCGEVAEEEGG